jgi:hypothetical protein
VRYIGPWSKLIGSFPSHFFITHTNENAMSNIQTRRRFIEVVPFVGIGMLAACSPKVEPPAPAVSAPPPPPPVAAASEPAPPPTTASAPAAPPPAAVAQNAAPAVLPMVDEKAAQAVALGYVADSARADKVKFSTYAAGRQCSGCALYQGKAGEASGPCLIFAGKQVVAKGWCSSWAKKV